jgi:hypothetical protein
VIICTSKIIVTNQPFTPFSANIFSLPDCGRSRRTVDETIL